MRVLFLYPYLPSPESGHGSARLVSRLLSDLRPLVDLTLVCAYRPGERHLVDSVRGLCSRLHAVERPFASDIGGVRRITHTTSTGIRLLATGMPLPVVKLRTPPLRRTVLAALAEGPYDLFHVELSVMAQFVEDWKGGPSVLVDHEAGDQMGEEPERWKSYVRGIYTRFSRVLTLTAEDRDELLGYEPSLKIEVRSPGISVPEKLTRHPKAGRVLFFGSPAHRPNRDALQWMIEEIVPALRSRKPRTEVVCAGIPEDDALAAAAKRAGIKMLGFVEDLGAEIDRAAVVLSPVRTGRGIRIKNLEAMARGAPVVTTSLGARGFSMLPPPGLHVADDVHGLVDRVLAIVQDQDAAERRAAILQAAVSREFSFARQAASTLALWNRLLEKP